MNLVGLKANEETVKPESTGKKLEKIKETQTRGSTRGRRVLKRKDEERQDRYWGVSG